jgi:hypothetical protein
MGYLSELVSFKWVTLIIISIGSFSTWAQDCFDEQNLHTSSMKEFIIHDDGTTTHLPTGLMWKRCLQGIESDNADCNSGSALTLSWQGALEHVQELNSNGGFAGYTDWRLPNPKELTSMIEYGCSKPSINLQVFPNMAEIRVWSSTISENIAGERYLKTWFSDYGASEVGNGSNSGTVSFVNANRESQAYAVHLVRGAQ